MVLPVGSHTAIENQKETVAMTTTPRAAATALLVLSLAAASAPIAGARPADFAPAGKRVPASVYDRPDRSMIPVSPPATSGGAIGRLALLSSAQQERQRVAAPSAYREGQLTTAFNTAATAANKARAPQAVVRIQTPQSGFDWG